MRAAGVGRRDDDRLQLGIRTTSALMAAGGLAALVIVPVAWGTRDFNGTGVAAMAAVMLVGSPTLLLAAPWVSWSILQAVAVVGTVIVTAGTYFAGPQQPFGAIFYLWVGIVVFLYLPRRAAVAITVLIAIEYGLLLALQEGQVTPAGRWLFVMATLVVTGTVVDRLVRRAEAIAEAERRARAALQEAQEKLAVLNASLEVRVSEQVRELDALSRLRRFLSPQVADAVVSSAAGGNDMLRPHRRLISVFFCDLRGFTSFAAANEPEEVMAVLDEYFAALGRLIEQFEATVGEFTGDGVMAYFNDPVPCDDPAVRALRFAIAVRDDVKQLACGWQRAGYSLGCGIGIALGYATLGQIGFEGRRDYGPVGTVVNLAARLCALAADDEILVDRRTYLAAGGAATLAERGPFDLKGIPGPVPVYCVLRAKSE